MRSLVLPGRVRGGGGVGSGIAVLRRRHRGDSLTKGEKAIVGTYPMAMDGRNARLKLGPGLVM